MKLHNAKLSMFRYNSLPSEVFFNSLRVFFRFWVTWCVVALAFLAASLEEMYKAPMESARKSKEEPR